MDGWMDGRINRCVYMCKCVIFPSLLRSPKSNDILVPKSTRFMVSKFHSPLKESRTLYLKK